MNPNLSVQFEAFKQTKSGQRDTPRTARNRCASASHDFHDLLNRGMPEHPENGYPRDMHLHVFEGHPALKDTGHIAVVHQGHVIDWTARQLDPAMGHPHVEPFESYRRRFESDEPYLFHTNGHPEWEPR